jgi:4-amino-4-deoxy-L-arabinose transferase-like glycosyltransferase
MDLNKKITLLFILVILFFSFLVRLPFLNVLMEADEGEIAYVSQQMEQGGIPYKDGISQKMPGMLYVYLFVFKIFGHQISDIRLFSFIYALVGVLLLYKLGALLFNKPVGLMASFIFGLISADPARFGFMAKAENFMLAPLIGSVIIFYLALKKKNNFLFFVCGLVNGLVFILKQSAIFNCLFIVVFLFGDFFVNRKEEKLFELVKRYFYFAAGFTMILLSLVIYFRFNGAWNDFIYWVFLHNLEYVKAGFTFSKLTNSRIWSTFFTQFRNMSAPSFIFWILGFYGIWHFIKDKNRSGLLITVWFIFLAISIFSGLHFFPHYFLLTTPVLAITAGYGSWLLFTKINGIKKTIIKRLITVLTVFLLVVLILGPHLNYWLVYSPKQISKLVYNDYYPLEARIKYIGEYINQNSLSDDRIFIFGTAPDILFYSQRRSATKYIIFYPLAEPSKDVLRIQKDIIREISLLKPKYIVDMTFNKKIFTDQYIVEAVKEILIRNYYPESFVSLTGDQETAPVLKINKAQLNYDFLRDKIILYRLR